MNKEKKTKRWLTLMSLGLCLILFGKRLTGEIPHILLGFLLSAVIVVHICRNAKKTKYMRLSVRLIDRLLIFCLAAVVLSGILLHPMRGVPAVLLVHKLSSVLFLLGMIVHVIQHKKNRRRGIRYYEKDDTNFLAGGRFLLFWTRNAGRYSSDSADRAFLHGDSILFCKKFQKTA